MKSILLFYIIVFMSGCVSNQAIKTVQVGDSGKSCDAISFELDQLGAKFEDVKDDSGVTGKNIGLALVFWPGIIVNEVRSNKNEDSVDARITHLTTIYNGKCSGDNATAGTQTLKKKLEELKLLLDDGILSDDEYKSARQKALDNH